MPTEPAACSLAAMRAQRAADARTVDVQPDPDRDEHQQPDEPEERPVVGERKAEHAEFRNAGDAHRAAGERQLHRDDDQHQMQRQRRHRQHEAAQLQHRRGDRHRPAAIAMTAPASMATNGSQP